MSFWREYLIDKILGERKKAPPQGRLKNKLRRSFSLLLVYIYLHGFIHHVIQCFMNIIITHKSIYLCEK